MPSFDQILSAHPAKSQGHNNCRPFHRTVAASLLAGMQVQLWTLTSCQVSGFFAGWGVSIEGEGHNFMDSTLRADSQKAMTNRTVYAMMHGGNSEKEKKVTSSLNEISMDHAHCKQDPIYVFPEMKLHGLVSNFQIHVS